MDFYGNRSMLPNYYYSALSSGTNPYKNNETTMSKSGNKSASTSDDKGASKSVNENASKSDVKETSKKSVRDTSKDDDKGTSKNGVIRYTPQKNPYTIKKRLNYNMREISSQILRANKAQSASIVLVRARAKVGNLMRLQVAGQYNENEVRSALVHARSMVRVANKKVLNLREEEQEKRGHVRKKAQKTQERKREIKAAIEEKKRELENAKRIEQMNEIQREKRERQAMEQKRRFHRNRERGKILEADMKYIKDQMDQNNDSEYRYDISGVVCSISASAAGLASLENEAVFLEAEIDAAMAASAEMAAEIADMGSAAFTGGMAASVGASVDISL